MIFFCNELAVNRFCQLKNNNWLQVGHWKRNLLAVSRWSADTSLPIFLFFFFEPRAIKTWGLNARTRPPGSSTWHQIYFFPLSLSLWKFKEDRTGLLRQPQTASVEEEKKNFNSIDLSDPSLWAGDKWWPTFSIFWIFFYCQTPSPLFSPSLSLSLFIVKGRIVNHLTCIGK